MSILQFWAHVASHVPMLASATWDNWRVLLGAFTGMRLGDVAAYVPDALARFQQLTGRTTWGAAPYQELWVVAGRRGGKTAAISILALYLATCRRYAGLLPGERGVVAALAADRRQARQMLRYVTGLVQAVPDLAEFLDGETRAEGIDFYHAEWGQATAIEVMTASFRLARSGTCVAVVADELAFWRTDESGANPDTEILAAVRPSLATTGGPLIAISSPYARRGELFEAHHRYYGVDEADTLVVQAPSWVLNPSLKASFLDREKERDPARFKNEYLALFRDDIESYVSEALVDRVVVAGRTELPPQTAWSPSSPPGHAMGPIDPATGWPWGIDPATGTFRPRSQPVAFIDPAGGAGQDSMTLAIAHKDRATGRLVLDLVREQRPPFAPSVCMAEFAAVMRQYGIGVAYGDRFAGDWPAEALRKCGLSYVPSQWNRSELYIELLPHLTGGDVELLDLPRLRTQLLGLERRTSRAGRDAIDHGPSAAAHDDVINAVAGAIVHSHTQASQQIRIAKVTGW